MSAMPRESIAARASASAPRRSPAATRMSARHADALANALAEPSWIARSISSVLIRSAIA